jgi:tetratricopeptide (TPR) repeat protein
VLGLARINKEKGNYLEAIESLSGLLTNDPKNPRLYVEIAQSYLALDKKDKALEILTRAVRLGIKSLGVVELLDKLQKQMPQ